MNSALPSRFRANSPAHQKTFGPTFEVGPFSCAIEQPSPQVWYNFSMNKHTINAEKTKNKLAAALKAKLKKKSFDKISILELTKALGINRKTFYYHFRSTDDLMAWMIEKETIEVLNQLDFVKDYGKAIDFLMDYIEENKVMLSSVNNSVGRKEVHNFLYRNIAPSVAGLLGKIDGADALDPDFAEFVVEFYTEAIVGTLQNWLEKDIPRDKETITRYTARLLRDAQMALS